MFTEQLLVDSPCEGALLGVHAKSPRIEVDRVLAHDVPHLSSPGRHTLSSTSGRSNSTQEVSNDGVIPHITWTTVITLARMQPP